MILLDAVLKSFSSAFNSIINTQIYYRSNRISLIQTGIILLLPQISAYLLEYNKEFGIKLTIKLENYPLLLFVLLVCTIYVVFEPRIKVKNANEIFKLALLSIHLFAFALCLNLVYAVILQTVGLPDFLSGQISNASTFFEVNLSPSTFAVFYGLPFLVLTIAMVFRNSYGLHPWRTRIIVRSAFFWRTFILSISLAVYQYMAFIVIGASPG